MRYPITIEPGDDETTAWGVVVPDLPGCFSAGDTTDDALSNAIEAIECHIEGLLLDGEKFPCPTQLNITVSKIGSQMRCGLWWVWTYRNCPEKRSA